MIDPQSIPGFLSPQEGALLRDAVAGAPGVGPVLEIGAYCGRSSLYLGAAARAAGTLLFSLDHHRGSEEHQRGEAYHDPAVWDAEAGCVDTLPVFRDAVRRAGLEGHVIALVGPSAAIARHWRTPLRFLFIDGGHSLQTALADWQLWATWVAPGGVLAIHDVLHRPADGGRPPHEVFLRATASGLFDVQQRLGSLVLLKRVD